MRAGVGEDGSAGERVDAGRECDRAGLYAPELPPLPKWSGFPVEPGSGKLDAAGGDGSGGERASGSALAYGGADSGFEAAEPEAGTGYEPRGNRAKPDCWAGEPGVAMTSVPDEMDGDTEEDDEVELRRPALVASWVTAMLPPRGSTGPNDIMGEASGEDEGGNAAPVGTLGTVL